MGTAAERQQSHYTLIYLCCPVMVVGGLVSSGDSAQRDERELLPCQ